MDFDTLQAIGMSGLLREALTSSQFQAYLQEATKSVEDELAAEDRGWINFSRYGATGLPDIQRVDAVRQARISYYTDPMAKQAIRLWTDYAFGEGMTWSMPDDAARGQKVIEGFWDDPLNQRILGTRGQRRQSERLLVDGEVFFVLFLGKTPSIRVIDPLEITEIITDKDDMEFPLMYRREYFDPQDNPQTAIYASTLNDGKKSAVDSQGKSVKPTEKGLIYHLPINTLGQRGTSLLLPAQFTLKWHRKFLASRIAIMLAMTRFAWAAKTKGGEDAVQALKSTLDGEKPAAGAAWISNESVDLNPIRTDTGASGAYQDGRMLRLQICSALGFPEQYFGDIATGNLATAKTVELPVQKMCSAYQRVWGDAYKDMCEVVMSKAGVPEAQWFIDFDFPEIVPHDAKEMSDILKTTVEVFPAFPDLKDIKSVALLSLGIDNIPEVLEELEKLEKEREKKKAEQQAQMPPEMQGQMGMPPQPPMTQEEATAELIGALRRYMEQGGSHGDSRAVDVPSV